jgi:hypothetical protein
VMASTLRAAFDLSQQIESVHLVQSGGRNAGGGWMDICRAGEMPKYVCKKKRKGVGADKKGPSKGDLEGGDYISTTLALPMLAMYSIHQSIEQYTTLMKFYMGRGLSKRRATQQFHQPGSKQHLSHCKGTEASCSLSTAGRRPAAGCP